MKTEDVRLACGVDLVDVAAFGRALKVTDGRMAKVCFTEQEQKCGDGRIDRLAGRWAVKEAVAKALGVGLMQGIGFHDIEVSAHADGQPDLILHGKAEKRAASLGLSAWAISVSHEGGLAMAFAVAVGHPASIEDQRDEEERDG